jgi:hypothetical protein
MVCDNMVLTMNLTKYSMATLPVSLLLEKLTDTYHLPQDLRNQYRIDLQPIDKLLLSPRGYDSTTKSFYICRSCDRSMEELHRKPPKMAIANGLFVGQIPETVCNVKLTRTEECICALIQTNMWVSSYKGGENMCLRSHNMCCNAIPITPIEHIPETNLLENFLVSMVGSFTPPQVAMIRKAYQVRGPIVIKFFAFLKQNNPLYKVLIN